MKIEGVFVKDIINEVGNEMGKLTIAEFVKNQQIREKLTQIGIDFSQGYRLGRPSRRLN